MMNLSLIEANFLLPYLSLFSPYWSSLIGDIPKNNRDLLKHSTSSKDDSTVI